MSLSIKKVIDTSYLCQTLVQVFAHMEFKPQRQQTKIRSVDPLEPDEALPDVSKVQKPSHVGTLSQVGMGQIEMPILFSVKQGGPSFLLPAMIRATVSLDDPDAKGIHMSRLYLELKNGLSGQPLTIESLEKILSAFLQSHEDLSESAYLEIQFQLPLERQALLSGEMGYRQYPVTYRARLHESKLDFVMSTEILYSSTCPCSAALARQLVQQEFMECFREQKILDKDSVFNWLGKEESIVAIPHAQRSRARIEVRMRRDKSALSVVELIDLAERALGTPVQSAVKRVDEQEFARLNAQNLMFCEDAARKLRGAFEVDERVLDYSIEVEHQESLHPHNAVSREVKGVAGGFLID